MGNCFFDLGDYFDWRLNEPTEPYPIQLPSDEEKHYGVDSFERV